MSFYASLEFLYDSSFTIYYIIQKDFLIVIPRAYSINFLPNEKHFTQFDFYF